MMPDVTSSIHSTIKRFYNTDLCTMLKHEILQFAKRFTKVGIDPLEEARILKAMNDVGGLVNELISKFQTGVDSLCNSDRPISHSEAPSLSQEKLEHDTYKAAMEQLGQIFRHELITNFQHLRSHHLQYVLSNFRLFSTTNQPEESQIFFKHLAIDLLGTEKIYQSIARRNPKIATFSPKIASEEISMPAIGDEDDSLGKFSLIRTTQSTRRQLGPPLCTERAKLEKNDLIGLVQHWDSKDPFVLSSAFFVPLTDDCTYLVVQELNQVFARDVTMRRQKLAHVRKALLLHTSLMAILLEANSFCHLMFGESYANIVDDSALNSLSTAFGDHCVRCLSIEAALNKDAASHSVKPVPK